MLLHDCEGLADNLGQIEVPVGWLELAALDLGQVQQVAQQLAHHLRAETNSRHTVAHSGKRASDIFPETSDLDQ